MEYDASVTWLTLLLATGSAHADEPLGTVTGLVDDRPWTWAVGVGGGAAIPVGGVAGAWAPAPQLAGRLETNTTNDVSVELFVASSSHVLKHGGRLVAGWEDEAPLIGVEQRSLARGGVRWARPGRVEPSLCLGLGVHWQRTRLDVPGTERELQQDLLWPTAAMSAALTTPIHGPLSARLSVEGGAVVGMDAGEVGPDAPFAVWTVASQLELVVRVPPR